MYYFAMTPKMRGKIDFNTDDFAIVRDKPHSSIIFPDYNRAKSFPNGTTTLILKDFPLHPNYVGFDIGCGYNFFELDNDILKKGKIKKQKLGRLIDTFEKSRDGVIGGGNHFVDILTDGQRLYGLIHSGSGKFGWETTQKLHNLEKESDYNTDFLRLFNRAVEEAYQNREKLRSRFPESKLLFDKPHNLITEEESYFVIQKGTQRIEPGERIVIPGNGRDGVYIVEGTNSLNQTRNTINHGCGRKFSRTSARNKFSRDDVQSQFGNIILNRPLNEYVEESPLAYRKLDDVIESIAEYVKPIQKLQVLAFLR